MDHINNKYAGMLPERHIDGRIGYYPVINAQEWETFSDLYKTMQWEPIGDPFDNKRMKAVKSVTFDVPYLEPLKPKNYQCYDFYRKTA